MHKSPIMARLESRIETARERYGLYSNPHEVLGVLQEEFTELVDAIHRNEWDDASAEALDIAAVCIRFANSTTIREREGQV